MECMYSDQAIDDDVHISKARMDTRPPRPVFLHVLQRDNRRRGKAAPERRRADPNDFSAPPPATSNRVARGWK